MNWRAVKAMYYHEMDRTRRTILQSILAPVISTSLYFVVFGSAIGSTKSDAVKIIIVPTIIDLVAAAPTNPKMISKLEIGAANNS